MRKSFSTKPAFTKKSIAITLTGTMLISGASAAWGQTNFAVTGHVYCICDSNAISGASIAFGQYSGLSDTNGSFNISNVLPGSYAATVYQANYLILTNTLTVTSGDGVVTNDFFLTNRTLVINPVFDSTITSHPNAPAITNTIKSAIQLFEKYIADAICVTILFTNTTDPTAFGGSDSAGDDLPYSRYLADLQANPHKSANDIKGLTTMPPGPSTGINNDATEVWLTAANLAAIGESQMASSLITQNGGLNGQIEFNLSYFNYSRPGQNSTRYDLQSVAEHEIGEVLGIGGSGSELGWTDVGPLDFYRYSAPNKRSFTFRSSAIAYFSIDGSKTNVNFNQAGSDTDYGDWGDGISPADGQGNMPPQVQDAFIAPDDMPDLGVNELLALDLIGYTLRVTTPSLMNVTYATNTFSFTWTATPGQSYQVQSTSTPTGIWTDLGSPITANDLVQSSSDSNPTDAQRFYRVVSLPSSTAPIGAALSSQIIKSPASLRTAAVKRHFLLR